MKFLTIAFLVSALSGAAMANPWVSTKNAAVNVGIFAGAVTITPTYATVMSFAACAQAPNIDVCVGKMSTSYGLVSSTSSVLLKEEIKNVEVDAYDYLAGADKTLALQEMIEKIRNNSEGSEEYSDEEIITAMLKVI